MQVFTFEALILPQAPPAICSASCAAARPIVQPRLLHLCASVLCPNPVRPSGRPVRSVRGASAPARNLNLAPGPGHLAFRHRLFHRAAARSRVPAQRTELPEQSVVCRVVGRRWPGGLAQACRLRVSFRRRAVPVPLPGARILRAIRSCRWSALPSRAVRGSVLPPKGDRRSPV